MENVIELSHYADAVVMLTWSDWATELRSNRYHYATRLAQVLPVLFVQPDLDDESYFFEETSISHVTILHLYNRYDSLQTALLNQALLERACLRPIFWVYNCNFDAYLASRFSVLNVFHGTEDYLASDSHLQFKEKKDVETYINAVNQCHLLISVSEGVKASFQSHMNFQGEIITVPNGCDYKFYSPLLHVEQRSALSQPKKTILYQGNIFDKIDYDLLLELVPRMPDWQFRFCGKVVFNEEKWQALRQLPNVKYLGLLSPDALRRQCYESTVGIIPFVQNEWIVDRSFPLKTFEYLAAGLPVVSVPIKSIMPFSDVILFAKTAEEFQTAIEQAELQRCDEVHTNRRLECAASQDYDIRFQTVKQAIEKHVVQETINRKFTVAVLYEAQSLKVQTIKEHLNSFRRFSKHHIVYLPVSQGLECTVDLNLFDAIVLHYSVRFSVNDGNWTLSPSYKQEVKSYSGYKVLFLQDEYEGTENARFWIQALGIHTVYTCVPEQYHNAVYPESRFSNVRFLTTLTGYVPLELPSFSHFKKTSERTLLIGYRGRALPYWYGSLGQEKLNIGIKVKEYCIERHLPVDIEWDGSKRIYGTDWYQFLASGRATLGTESGANIFDEDGSIRAAIEEKIAENPDLTYDEIYESHIAPYETIKMNQISPKIFEAIALRTVLVLFEGEYSNVLTPDAHYLSLKKDFSNLDDIISKLHDDVLVDTMTERAYQDIIQSGTYSYKQFVQNFDDYIVSELKNLVDNKVVCITVCQLRQDELISKTGVYTFLPDTQITTNQHQALYNAVNEELLIKHLNDDLLKVLVKILKMKSYEFVRKTLPVPIKTFLIKLMNWRLQFKTLKNAD